MKTHNPNRVTVDFANVFDSAVGSEHGISAEEIRTSAPLIYQAHTKLQRMRKDNVVGFFDLPYQKGIVNSIKSFVESKKDAFDTFVVLGIGGSALGNTMLQSALNHTFHNMLDKNGRQNGLRLFVLDNIDPVLIRDLLEIVDVDKTLFNVITKSGSTAETMSQFLIFKNILQKKLGDQHKKNILATTSNDKGILKQIVDREGYDYFVIPENVGGRFSVLTPVGLVSAAFAGIDIEELLTGAAFMDSITQSPNVWKNPAYMNGIVHYLADTKKGKNISVMMPYSQKLRDFADWYRQLWAESLGKKFDRDNNEVYVGQTPVKALGVTDQHSQVQLYTEGPNDKIFTFISVDNDEPDVAIPHDYEDVEGVHYLGGHGLKQLLDFEKKGTEYALTSAKRPNMTVHMPRITPFTIGELIYLYEVQTAFCGELYNINAFDQPGVELGKNITYALMGRKGYQEHAEKITSRSSVNPEYII